MRSILVSILMFSGLAFSQPINHLCGRSASDLRTNRLVIEDLRSDSVDIVHTALTLDFTSMSTKEISGYADLSLKALMTGVDTLRFDFEGLVVDSVVADNFQAFTHQGASLKVVFNQDLPLGQEVVVRVYYHGFPIKDASNWGGFYFTGAFAWNLGVGFAADPHSYGRIWFPCFDNFIERSSFEFYITTPPGKFASCNGLLQDSSVNSAGNPVFHWTLGQPIPSYLAGVAIGEYEMLESTFVGEQGNFPVQLFARASDTSNLKQSFVHLHDAIAAFESGYGVYRFDKVGYSLVPFNAGAMEHATNITYPIYAANGGLSNESLMTHELAHMWWGDNVTCKTDGDMWINEGWASFSEFLFDEAVYGKAAYETSLLEDLRYMLQYGHYLEGGYRAVSGQTHEYVYGDHVYKKGALVANNLRAYMGDTLFFQTIKAFMDMYEYSPVSSTEMEDFFSVTSGLDLSHFFDDWVHSAGWNVVVLDSFRTTQTGTVYTTSLYLQQKLKGRDQYHEGVPVYFTAYDAQWNKEEGLVHMSGPLAEIEVTTTINPKLIIINERHQMAYAQTADQKVFNAVGNHALANMYWDVEVKQITDSALVRFEQVWSYPDPLKDWVNKAYKLNDNRYWRVSGLDLDKIEMSGTFFYDGRAGGSTGYLDVSLLTETEDSLVLLYRASSGQDWEEYGHYTKNILGIATNAVGLIELEKILPGEYTLANRDNSVLGIRNALHRQIQVYPNPTSGKVTISNDALDEVAVRFYTLDGKMLKLENLKPGENVIELTVLNRSVVLYEVRSKNCELLFSGKLIIDPESGP